MGFWTIITQFYFYILFRLNFFATPNLSFFEIERPEYRNTNDQKNGKLNTKER